MISINGFYLSKYRETEGWEGYGYCATLKYGKTTAATYADYATGAAPDIELLPGGDWRTALEQTLRILREGLPEAGVSMDGIEEQVTTMCQLLVELREAHRGCHKAKADGSRFSVALLVGAWWSLAPKKDTLPAEAASIIRRDLPGSVQTLAVAKDHAVDFFKEVRARRGFLTCPGVWIIDRAQEPKQELTVEQLVNIFKLANELSAQPEGGM